jgi:hypothetical protein
MKGTARKEGRRNKAEKKERRDESHGFWAKANRKERDFQV